MITTTVRTARDPVRGTALCSELRSRGERGSATVELVVVTPLLILLALIVVALGRLVDARLVVGDAAHQAARAASLARTERTARNAAEEAASAAFRDARSSCIHPDVQLNTGGLRPGGTVIATISCTADLGDLTRSGMPGSLALRSEAISPVDTYRSAR